MARKTRDLATLTPAYRARVERDIARAAAEGREPNRQRARGQKPGEHKIRKQRAETLGQLTSGQKTEVRKFVREQAARRFVMMPADEVEKLVTGALAWATHHGYPEFLDARREQRRRQKDYEKTQWKVWDAHYKVEGWDFATAARYGMGFADAHKMFWYH